MIIYLNDNQVINDSNILQEFEVLRFEMMDIIDEYKWDIVIESFATVKNNIITAIRNFLRKIANLLSKAKMIIMKKYREIKHITIKKEAFFPEDKNFTDYDYKSILKKIESLTLLDYDNSTDQQIFNNVRIMTGKSVNSIDDAIRTMTTTVDYESYLFGKKIVIDKNYLTLEEVNRVPNDIDKIEKAHDLMQKQYVNKGWELIDDIQKDDDYEVDDVNQVLARVSLNWRIAEIITDCNLGYLRQCLKIISIYDESIDDKKPS